VRAVDDNLAGRAAVVPNAIGFGGRFHRGSMSGLNMLWAPRDRAHTRRESRTGGLHAAAV